MFSLPLHYTTLHYTTLTPHYKFFRRFFHCKDLIYIYVLIIKFYNKNRLLFIFILANTIKSYFTTKLKSSFKI